MAMVKVAQPITEINGKSGGNVWRKDQCGQHVQKTPRTVSNEPTRSQRKRQKAYTACMNYIRRNSTPEFAARWQQYANNHPKTNKKGETYNLTWWQQFMAINVVRVFNDQPIQQYPPSE